ncbi:hypothetical protein I350_04568 [Cryptococcus amylolentus CBS 6273]|uniref:Uncharacterized protein n=1 Tax=Cryptococcus amylolentus CBS 6273 TaxID=1296118 RepID=A0A1E3JZ77_9TREE|nr:hypothetical protein I350_04568 [Cryptococcus amylolentus CBS 6273]
MSRDLTIIPKPDTVTVDFTVPSECSLVQEAQAYLRPVSSTANRIAEALSLHVASPSRGAGGSSNPYEFAFTREGCSPVISLMLNSEHYFAYITRAHSWLKAGRTSSIVAIMPESTTTKDEARTELELLTKAQTTAVDMASTLGLQQSKLRTEIQPSLAELEENNDKGWEKVQSFVSDAITSTYGESVDHPAELIDLSSMMLDGLQEEINPERSVPFPVDTLRAFGNRKRSSILTTLGRFL